MSTDELAAEIVGRCRERIDAGEDVDVDAIVRAHPEIATTLRERFDALARLDRGFGRRMKSDAEAPSLVGRSLGAWRLVSVLGAGGMGTVFLAQSGDDRAAVKVIHAHLLARRGFFERFLREAEIGQRVRHENVVATLGAEAADVDGRAVHFLVMEHVEGRTLRGLLDELGRVPEELCRHVGREVAKALVAIHAAGAVHRDLKPDNVLITRDHIVKVMDLGVARLAEEAARISQTGAFVGSVRYAAPEQFGPPAPRGATSETVSAKGVDAIDGRADLYALGLTLYELATGAHPFEGDELRAVVRRQLMEAPRPAGEVNPQLSPFFEEVLRRLLEKDRDARFASAAAVLDVLEQGESSAWWQDRAKTIRADTRRPLRRIRIPRETSLYGRDAELALLRSLYERAKQGDGQVAVIEGEAGIGKSRLVDEFVGRLAQAGEDVNFLYGSYPPGGAATAAGAFTSAYREQLGDDESSVRAALPQTPLLVPAFAALLRGDAAPEHAEPLTKDSLQTVFVHATRSFAAQRTTIVLIDDLHFAPAEGRALFASLALAVEGHRILLVGTARPEIDATWVAQVGRAEHVSRIPLPRLGAKDLVLLLGDSLRSGHLAEELGAKIAVKSDGNPFFVFEILRGLRDGRYLTRGPDGAWTTTKLIAEIEVPGTVKELIFARVSGLTTEARNLLDVAACAGFDFDPVIVGEVLHVGRIPVLQRLAAVEKSHRLVHSSGRRFVFDHHQVAEVLYAGLPEMLREEYHAAIGTALESRSGAASKEPGDLDGALCVDLAQHFLEGAQGSRALRYLDAALTHLEEGYLNDAATRLLDRALAASGLVEGEARCRLLLRKAARLDFLGRRDEQAKALEEAKLLADASGAPGLRALARTSLGLFLRNVSQHEAARSVVEEALALSRETGDKRAEATARGILGIVFQSVGRNAEGQKQFGRALELAREFGDPVREAGAIVNLGCCSEHLGRYGEAQSLLEQGLAICRRIGHRQFEATATGNLGNVFESLGRFAEAQAQYERHYALAREIGDRATEAIALVNLGPLRLVLGDTRPAQEALRASLALCREIGARYPEGYALEGLGWAADEAGDAAGAQAWIEESLALRRRIGHGDGVADSLVALGDLRRRTGDVHGARSALEEALSLSREQGREPRAALALALLACLPGGPPQDGPQEGLDGPGELAKSAEATLTEAGEGGESLRVRYLLWQATGDPTHLAAANRLLGELLAKSPPEHRESMLANVRLHREVAAAAREHGLPLAADASREGDGRPAGSAGA